MDTAKLIDFISSLTVTEGQGIGDPFTVLPWERSFLEGTFQDDVSTAALSVARGNGKTSVCATLGAASLDGPLRIQRGLTLIVASSFDQGRTTFDHILWFLGRERLRNRKVWRVWDSANRALIEHLPTGARVKIIGSDPRRAHGSAPHLILADEPAQWETAKSDRMRAALKTAAGKQPFCRFVALGTRPAAPGHWFDKLLRGGADFVQLHTAPKLLMDEERKQGGPEPKFKREHWLAANPSLDFMPNLEREIRKGSGRGGGRPGADGVIRCAAAQSRDGRHPPGVSTQRRSVAENRR